MTRGLLDPEEVVTGRVMFRDVSRRNLAVVAERKDRDGLFVKMARDTLAAPAITQEAAALRRLGRTDAADVVPRLLLDDGVLGLMVVTAPRGARDLSSGEREVAAGGIALAELLGEGLARVHCATAEADGSRDAAPPWALMIHRPATEALGVQTPASLKLIALIQSEDRACRALDALRDAWRPSCLTHGDLKHENVLVAETVHQTVGVTLVDWEQAGSGDPLWDVASAAAAFLSEWMYALDLGHAHPSVDIDRVAEPGRGLAAGAVSALWRAYTAVTGEPLGNGATHRLIRLAGARLLARANEATQSGAALTPHVALHVQLGVNLLSDPETHGAWIGLA